MPQAKAVNFTMPVFPYDRWGGIEPLARSVKAAEELGFWGVRLPEHIIMPVRPGAPSVSTVWYDNFVLGAHLATLTERIKIVFSVMVIPYRPPVQTAKLIATLDQVSKGRLIVGTGVGWMRGEFRVLGLSHAERGAVTDDYLAAMRELWTSDAPSYEGKYARFGNIAFEPKCYQQPHVPLWIGGSGPAAERRVAEFGDGWIPMVGELPGLADDVARIKAATTARGPRRGSPRLRLRGLFRRARPHLAAGPGARHRQAGGGAPHRAEFARDAGGGARAGPPLRRGRLHQSRRQLRLGDPRRPPAPPRRLRQPGAGAPVGEACLTSSGSYSSLCSLARRISASDEA